MDKLLTAQEVADFLKLDIETVRRYTRSGRLRALRLGRHLRVRVSDLKDMLSASEIQSDRLSAGSTDFKT